MAEGYESRPVKLVDGYQAANAINLGSFTATSNVEAIGKAFDALPASMIPILGHFSYDGRFLFIGFKWTYLNVDYGMMITTKYNDGPWFMSSDSYGKHYYRFNTTSV